MQQRLRGRTMGDCAARLRLVVPVVGGTREEAVGMAVWVGVRVVVRSRLRLPKFHDYDHAVRQTAACRWRRLLYVRGPYRGMVAEVLEEQEEEGLVVEGTSMAGTTDRHQPTHGHPSITPPLSATPPT